MHLLFGSRVSLFSLLVEFLYLLISAYLNQMLSSSLNLNIFSDDVATIKREENIKLTFQGYNNV